MPVYEYACNQCGRSTEIFVRSAGGEGKASCAHCGSDSLRRVPARFAYKRSLKSRVEQLDPKYDRMIDASNPDLSFDSLRQKYRLDRPATAKNGE